MTVQTIKIGMKPSHPGDFVRLEVIAPLGLSISRTVELLGVRRATLFDLLNGKSTCSPEMALRLEKAFGTNMEMLLRMQAWDDAARMREKERACVKKRTRFRFSATGEGARPVFFTNFAPPFHHRRMGGCHGEA